MNFVAISASLSPCCLGFLYKMRLTILHAPNLLLTFLPLVIAYNGHGIFGTIMWMILWAVFRQAVVMYHIIQKKT